MRIGSCCNLSAHSLFTSFASVFFGGFCYSLLFGRFRVVTPFSGGYHRHSTLQIGWLLSSQCAQFFVALKILPSFRFTLSSNLILSVLHLLTFLRTISEDSPLVFAFFFSLLAQCYIYQIFAITEHSIFFLERVHLFPFFISSLLIEFRGSFSSLCFRCYCYITLTLLTKTLFYLVRPAVRAPTPRLICRS